MLEKQVNIAEAKKHFSEIVGKVAYGNVTFVFMKRGVPMAKLVPVGKNRKHPADVKGWLSPDDPFFTDIESFRSYIPRMVRRKAY